MIDLFGDAILDYYNDNAPEDLVTKTNITEPDVMPVAYLFRNFDAMPLLEQQAMRLAKGNILDVGCGAGSHSLYLQNINNNTVTSIDISPNAIKACKLRGVKNALVQDVMTIDSDDFQNKFDTILLLMNGTGICGKLEKFSFFLQKLKSLLRPNGQILIDSTDILYMYDVDDLEFLKHNGIYYGELDFTLAYKDKTEKPFSWLYLDYKKLKIKVLDNNMQIKKIVTSENHAYLARIF